MIRLLALCGLLTLAACASGNDLDRPPVPLGEFVLGHNVVVAPNLTKGPLSRDATKEEWITAVKTAMGNRFGRYDGSQIYHIGLSVDGYVLAQPGIPLVMAPKSVVIVNVTVFEDATGRKLNETAEQISVVEALGAGPVVGSGYTQSREEQLEGLAVRIAKEVEIWMQRQHREKGWFDKREDATEATAGTETAAAE